MLTRRQFLKLAAAAGASTFVSGSWFTGPSLAAPAGVAPAGIASWKTQSLRPWVDPLPVMPVAVPPALGGGREIKDPLTGLTADFYAMEARESSWQFHSDLPPARTNSYWYGGSKLEYAGVGAPISGYLGPSIVAQKGKPVVLQMVNKLPLRPLYADAYDRTIGGGRAAMYPNTSRIAVHLHGGFVAPQVDGHPDSWFGPDGSRGTAWHSPGNPPANGYLYAYPNRQRAGLLWYHDHSMYQTRFNPFAGQAAGYVIADADDTVVSGGLNVPKFPYDVPLVIQDRTFYSDGSMFYPTASGLPAAYPHPIWQPEYFGDTPVVNGKAYPFLAVEPRRYRLRFLNGSQARFYELSLGFPMWLIGTEGGLLPRPVQMSRIVLAPAERADVIVDFANYAGTDIPLRNTAKAPYPNGADTRVPIVIKFLVNKPLAGKDTTLPPQQLTLPAMPTILPPPSNAKSRDLVLKESFDPVTLEPIDVRINGRWFEEPAEETPKIGSTEIWNWVNLTEDAHPMHTHLAMFQVLGRVPFDIPRFERDWFAWIAAGRNPATQPKALNYATGPRQAPAADEVGWKDTVKAQIGVITQIVAKFEVPPGSQRGNAKSKDGFGYVYHCHILEHEENEMMRPYVVVP